MHKQRRHDIDALRAIAFGLLILYHVGMFYVPWDWHVKSTHIADWLQLPMTLLNQWRMPLIFLISGMAVNFLLGEGNERRLSYGSFARLRCKRLLLPLLFGMAFIIPPQPYYQAMENGVSQPGYVDFLIRYFTFQTWPEGAFDGSDIGITWNHLWYLPYLLVYTLALIPLAWLLDGPLAPVRTAFRNLRGAWLVLVPVCWLIPIGVFVYPIFPYVSHDLVSDGYAHAMYGSFFLFGYLIGKDPGYWAELSRLRWPALLVACAAFVLLQLANEFLDTDQSALQNLLQLTLIYVNRWLWIVAILGWGHQLLNRPMSWLNYANRAVFPWYILHQTITVVAGYHLARMPLGPVLEPILLVALTIAGCAAGMWLVERGLPWLSPYMGMKILQRQSKTPRTSLGRKSPS